MSNVVDDITGLDIIDDEVCMAWSGKAPWNNLGKQVEPGSPAHVYLKEAKLDWNVEKIRYTYHHNGKDHNSTRVALVKSTDSFELTTISGNWEPVQNIEAFNFFDEFVEAGNMSIETVGSLCHGRKVWALARIKESIDVFKGDVINPYLLFTIPHEYGFSTDLRFTPIRVECLNSIILAMYGKSDSYKVNHRRKFDPEMAKKVLGLASQKLHEYKSNIEFLGTRRAQPIDVLEYFKTVFPSVSTKITEETISRPAKAALKVLNTQPGAKFAEGSWWQPLNAVTFIIDHILGKTSESRMNSAWYGQNRVKKVKALEEAMLMAEKSAAL